MGRAGSLISMAGRVSFVGGFVIAILTGIWWPENAGLLTVLVIMGLIVGILNISEDEVLPFLVAAIALVIVGTTGTFVSLNNVSSGFGDRVDNVARQFALFMAPAAVVVALRAAITLAKPGDQSGDMKVK